jgi:hypothetical protein
MEDRGQSNERANGCLKRVSGVLSNREPKLRESTNCKRLKLGVGKAAIYFLSAIRLLTPGHSRQGLEIR